MGADLILSFVDVSEPKQKWLDILGEWNDAQVDKFVADAYQCDIWDPLVEQAADSWDADGVEYSIDDPEFLAEVRQAFVERLNDAIDLAYGDVGRNSVKVLLDGKPWAITGGSSWGDDPSDEFADFLLAEAFIEYLKGGGS
jgi:hypothetical protein